jgi:nucleoside 2-deoxyribosyltransferase
MVLAYLSAPIIHSNLRKDDFCHTVITALEDAGITVFAPHLLDERDAITVYRRDVEQVRLSDFVIAEVSSPSLGVGMEIMLAIDLVKPVIMFYRSDVDRISKMIFGADGKALFEYSSMKDVERILHSMNLDSLIVQKCASCSSQVAEVLEDEIRCVACGHSERDFVV